MNLTAQPCRREGMQLLSRDGMKAWLLSKPDPQIVAALMDYTDWWSEQLRNGGGNFAQDIRKIGTDYLVDLARQR